MKYIVRCKKTLYYNNITNKFGNSRHVLSKDLVYIDLFHSLVELIAKKDQIAIVDTNKKTTNCKLDLLSGITYNVNLDVIMEYFDPIYLDDTCFETKKKLIKKGIQ